MCWPVSLTRHVVLKICWFNLGSRSHFFNGWFTFGPAVSSSCVSTFFLQYLSTANKCVTYIIKWAGMPLIGRRRLKKYRRCCDLDEKTSINAGWVSPIATSGFNRIRSSSSAAIRMIHSIVNCHWFLIGRIAMDDVIGRRTLGSMIGLRLKPQDAGWEYSKTCCRW